MVLLDASIMACVLTYIFIASCLQGHIMQLQQLNFNLLFSKGPFLTHVMGFSICYEDLLSVQYGTPIGQMCSTLNIPSFWPTCGIGMPEHPLTTLGSLERTCVPSFLLPSTANGLCPLKHIQLMPSLHSTLSPLGVPMIQMEYMISC